VRTCSEDGVGAWSYRVLSGLGAGCTNCGDGQCSGWPICGWVSVRAEAEAVWGGRVGVEVCAGVRGVLRGVCAGCGVVVGTGRRGAGCGCAVWCVVLCVLWWILW